MKKMFMMAAALIAALTMNAQHVTPLDVKMVDVNLEPLRTEYKADKNAYLVQLQHLELDLKGNAEVLKQARKQLDEEKAYSKCIADYVKYATKLLKTYEKSCQEEIKDLNDMLTTIDKQTATAQKLALIVDTSKPKFIGHMANERGQVAEQIEKVTALQQMIVRQQAQVGTIQAGLDIYNAEITTKDNDLTLKDNVLKANTDMVKQELKNVKAEIKTATK